jgi:hypothetical protein
MAKSGEKHKVVFRKMRPILNRAEYDIGKKIIQIMRRNRGPNGLPTTHYKEQVTED